MKILRQHSCPGFPKGVDIHEAEPGNLGRWILELSREADEDDLEQNHVLEEIGDLMDVARVEIGYCPYCGAKLADHVGKVGPSFWHIK